MAEDSTAGKDCGNADRRDVREELKHCEADPVPTQEDKDSNDERVEEKLKRTARKVGHVCTDVRPLHIAVGNQASKRENVQEEARARSEQQSQQ